jgi:hypothetical protein
MRTSWITLATLLACALATDAGAAQPAPGMPTNEACSTSAGTAKADEYVKQCLAVTAATHPPCNAANACELMIEEIRRGCLRMEADAPAFCTAYKDIRQQ